MIKLIDNFVVDQDSLNYILGEEKTVEKGKHKGEVYTSTLGFYPSLFTAVFACRKELVRRELMKEYITLTDAMMKIESIDARFIQFLEEKFGK